MTTETVMNYDAAAIEAAAGRSGSRCLCRTVEAEERRPRTALQNTAATSTLKRIAWLLPKKNIKMNRMVLLK